MEFYKTNLLCYKKLCFTTLISNKYKPRTHNTFYQHPHYHSQKNYPPNHNIIKKQTIVDIRVQKQDKRASSDPQ